MLKFFEVCAENILLKKFFCNCWRTFSDSFSSRKMCRSLRFSPPPKTPQMRPPYPLRKPRPNSCKMRPPKLYRIWHNLFRWIQRTCRSVFRWMAPNPQRTGPKWWRIVFRRIRPKHEMGPPPGAPIKMRRHRGLTWSPGTITWWRSAKPRPHQTVSLHQCRNQFTYLCGNYCIAVFVWPLCLGNKDCL